MLMTLVCFLPQFSTKPTMIPVVFIVLTLRALKNLLLVDDTLECIHSGVAVYSLVLWP